MHEDFADELTQLRCEVKELRKANMELRAAALASSQQQALFQEARQLIQPFLATVLPHVATWQIVPKLIGRSDGCVLVSETDVPVRYYAKTQPLCLKTMFVYRILERIGCGPNILCFVAHQVPSGTYDNWIVTREVPGFRMASSCSNSGKKQEYLPLPPSEAMLIVLLASLFQFQDVPSNKDNWGVSHNGTRLVIVDFSFAQLSIAMALTNKQLFIQTYGTFCAAGTISDFDFDTHRRAFSDAYSQYFGSIEAFETLVRCAMDDVCSWVNDHEQQTEWRNSLGFFGNITLLNQLNTYQEVSCKFFAAFAAWFFARAVT